ncbi:MAG TPA: HAMP domain-containing sensor histidine kinase, partial [Coriobacteriia bacterium]
MTWIVAFLIGITAAAAFAAGLAVGTLRQRSRLRRITEGASQLARGNLAHRIMLPGDDQAAEAAETLNALADAVQQEREAAAARDAAQRQLLADISHDLRTPITSIAGYTDALQRGLGDEPERYLAVIAAKAEALAQLTDDLFYAARIDAGDLELARGPIDLAEAVRRSVLGFEPQLAGAGVHVDVRIPDERCMVDADQSALARILTNLVSNSVHHGAGMTTFGVAMASDRGESLVQVSNDGARLPEDAERLFRRGVAGPSGGTGLGLAIARELAEQMGGS